MLNEAIAQYELGEKRGYGMAEYLLRVKWKRKREDRKGAV